MKKFSVALVVLIGLGAGCCCTGDKKEQTKALWNGEPTIDYETDRLTTGYIGLQNHDAKSTVKFRNLRITENVRVSRR